MKYSLLTVTLLIISYSICYCQEDNINQYNSISDSLEKYQNSSLISGVESLDSIVQDYIDLDYYSFKSKYDLSHEEMVETAHALEVTYQIARSDINIERSVDKFDSTFSNMEYDSIESRGDDMFIIDTLDMNSLKIEIKSYEKDTIR
ncbi:hypothetical protein [Brumimicrobium aurantiacum]|uniref:DUF4296 domain-containing protein n=1 Tax=Brumimicrobium aurantiacum TaxID=1737063 RepID=A0A3E1F1S5_9FLAO|nr:hypothetical protein [Brumimicrobium aurantiacum]RFC55667.1 hypothetical protein DXU93_01665 [Brumimicrobium aurantiacum]